MAGDLRYTISLKDQVANGLDNLVGKFGAVDRSAAKAESTIASLGKGIAAYFAIDKVKDFGMAVFDVGVSFDKLNNKLKFSEGGQEGATQRFDYLVDVSRKYALELESVAKGYSTIAAASRGTSLEGTQTEKIFEGISKASATLSLSGEETEGALLAISQMISKGKISAEELRGQLGERLPGAFQLMAKAAGVTTVQLDDMMKEGKLLSDVYLPLLGQKLNETFSSGAEDNVKTLGGQLNLFRTESYLTYKTLAEEFKPAFISALNTGREFVVFLKDAWFWYKRNKEVIDVLAISIGLAVVAWKAYVFWQNLGTIGSLAYNAAVFISMVATDGLAAALYAAGIAGQVAWASITLGISLVVAGLVTAWKKSEAFRGAIYGLWYATKQVFTNIGDFFKKTFNPIFKAIDNFNNGNYKEAARNVAELAYNLHPQTIAKNASEYLAKDVSSEYKKGNVLGRIAQREDRDKDFVRNLKSQNISGLAKDNKVSASSLVAPNVSSKSASSVNGSMRNITINIGKLVEDLTIKVNDNKSIVPRLKEEITKAIISATNDFRAIAQ